jgi:hypothetical protein
MGTRGQYRTIDDQYIARNISEAIGWYIDVHGRAGLLLKKTQEMGFLECSYYRIYPRFSDTLS